MKNHESTVMIAAIAIFASIMISFPVVYGQERVPVAAEESSNTGQSSVPAHNILPETSNHATTLTPIHVTTTHHNITAANLNNGMLGPLAAKPTMHTLASAPTTHINGLEVRNTPLVFDPKTEICKGSTYAVPHTSMWAEKGYLGCDGSVSQLPKTQAVSPLNHLNYGANP